MFETVIGKSISDLKYSGIFVKNKYSIGKKKSQNRQNKTERKRAGEAAGSTVKKEQK